MARAKLNEHGVTEQQEKFCQAFVETGNASESYRRAYKIVKMAPNTIAVRASELLDKGNIQVRLEQLRSVHRKRHNVTVDSLVAELEQIKQIALSAETPQSSAAVAAVMGKAKLTGLDKQLIEMSGSLSVTLSNSQRATLDKALDDEY